MVDLWIDDLPESGSTLRHGLAMSALAAAQGVGSSVLGTVVATPVEEPGLPEGWVRAEIPADSPTSEVTGRTDGGVYALGAVVMVQLDSTGRVVMIHAPLSLPDGAEPVGMGVAGKWLLENDAKVAEAAAEAAQAVEEARAAVAEGEKAQARADEVSEQARVDRARLEEVAAEAARVSGAEAKAQDAWNRAVAAGETADAALAAAPDLAGPWPGNWFTNGSGWDTSSASERSVTNSAPGMVSGVGYVATRHFVSPATRSGRTYRFELVVSSTANAVIRQQMNYYSSAPAYVRDFNLVETRLQAGTSRRLVAADYTPEFTDATPNGRFVVYVAAGGGTVTIHSARVVDVTDIAAAMAAAQAAQDAASTASQSATRAQATADGKNQITRSTATPSGSGKTAGDVWWRYGTSSLSGAIIGAWTWDGSRWQPSQIGSEIVASLTADKLRAANGELDSAFVNNLVNHKVFTDELYASRVVVAGANLFPDPLFENADAWKNGICWVASSPGLAGGRCLRVTAIQGGQASIYYNNSARTTVVETGAKYRVKARVYVSGSNAKTGMGLRFYMSGLSSNGGAWQYAYVNLAPRAVNSWEDVEAVITAPLAYDGLVCVGFAANESMRVAGPYGLVGNVQVTRMTGAILLEDGAVTAPKINAQEVAAETAKHIRLSTDQLYAGNVKIASDLIAPTITGKTINGSHFNGGDITFVDGSVRTVMNSAGLTHYDATGKVGQAWWRTIVAPPWGVKDRPLSQTHPQGASQVWIGGKAAGNAEMLRNGMRSTDDSLIVPLQGWYLVSGYVLFNNNLDYSGIRGVSVYLDGSDSGLGNSVPGHNYGQQVQFNQIIYLGAGTKVELWCYIQSNTVNHETKRGRMSVRFIGE